MKKIKDGIVDLKKYESSKHKILWILKEGNVSKKDHDKDRDLCEEIRTDQHKHLAMKIPTFRKMIYATYGILFPEVEWSEGPNATELYDVLKYIAYINLNKFPGGGISNYDNIKQAYIKNKDEILSQIEKYNPNIIIFGNTLRFFETEDLKKIGWSVSDINKNYVDENKVTSFYIISSMRLCINTVHPSYPKISNRKYWFDIKSAVDIWTKHMKE